jgi:hypothetical protein
MTHVKAATSRTRAVRGSSTCLQVKVQWFHGCAARPIEPNVESSAGERPARTGQEGEKACIREIGPSGSRSSGCCSHRSRSRRASGVASPGTGPGGTQGQGGGSAGATNAASQGNSGVRAAGRSLSRIRARCSPPTRSRPSSNLMSHAGSGRVAARGRPARTATGTRSTSTRRSVGSN